jgi:hypothetical protein
MPVQRSPLRSAAVADERRKRLAASTAVAVRVDSRQAFAGQDQDAAFATLDQAFPAVLAPVPEPIPASDRVVAYGNGDHAIVTPANAPKGSAKSRDPAAVQCYAGARQTQGATPYPAVNAVSGCLIGAVNPDPNGPN